MRFVSFDDVKDRLRGRSIAIVGSGPSSCLTNPPRFVDEHDIVVRINNYKLGDAQGRRCDVFYSFFGGSIRKTARELMADGVKLCMCKCPNSKPLQSEWHERNRKPAGIDFRYIYEQRRGWFFGDTFVPDDAHFLRGFELLGKHIPTTGFAAILDVLACEPATVYLTGFDFFASGIHNVDEKWRPGRADDPIGHRPERELAWLADNARKHPLFFDKELTARVNGLRQVAA